ncbi:hypothetical protein EMCRGX_G031462 [Ephydatia muelleri]
MIYILGGSPASAGLDTTCQEKILSSLQSLQDQIAELRSSTATSSTAATAPEPPKEKRIAKELSSAIHSTVKYLRDQTENAMDFTDIANRRVTDEVATACQSDKFPAAVVRKAARIYFASLKRRSKMVLAGKLDESKKRQRKVQRKHNKAHSRMNASTAITAEEKNEATKILTVDFMSSEETGQETAGSDNERVPPATIFKLRPLPWRSDRANSIIASMDRKAQRRSSDRAKEMCRKRYNGDPSTRQPPPSAPAWAVKELS